MHNKLGKYQLKLSSAKSYSPASETIERRKFQQSAMNGGTCPEMKPSLLRVAAAAARYFMYLAVDTYVHVHTHWMLCYVGWGGGRNDDDGMSWVGRPAKGRHVFGVHASERFTPGELSGKNWNSYCPN